MTLVAATIFPDNRKALDACRVRNRFARAAGAGGARVKSFPMAALLGGTW